MESSKELPDWQDDVEEIQESLSPSQQSISVPTPDTPSSPPVKRRHKKSSKGKHGQGQERQDAVTELSVPVAKKNVMPVEKPVTPTASSVNPARGKTSIEPPQELPKQQNRQSETQMVLVPDKKTEPDIPAITSPLIPVRKMVTPLVELVRTETIILWTPAPISMPVVNRELPEMPAIDRVMEVWRYSLLSGEYALSSNGLLREWFKLVIKIAIFLMIPVFIFVPIVTFFMASFSGISGYFLEITGNILWAMINILMTVLTALTIGVVFFSVRKFRDTRKRKEPSSPF